MATGALLSIGGVAEPVGRSPAILRIMEPEGAIPRALRLVDSDRRVYRVTEHLLDTREGVPGT